MVFIGAGGLSSILPRMKMEGGFSFNEKEWEESFKSVNV